MANSASLLLPVSNLTNLLALPHLDLDVRRLRRCVMAPVLAVVLVVEYVGLRLLFRARPGRRAEPAPADPRAAGPAVPVVVVAAMLLGFAVVLAVRWWSRAGSPAAAAVVLVGVGAGATGS